MRWLRSTVEIESSWTHDSRRTVASTSAVVPRRARAAKPCASIARRRTAVSVMRGPLIEGFYPTTTDAAVTLLRVRRLVIICAVVLGAAYAIGIPAFLERDDDPLPPTADAIVVLSGSDNRLPAAQALFGGGLAPTLVVSAERGARDTRRARLCRRPPDGVVCIHAGPFSTVSEAQAVGELAKRNDWDSLILVSSRYEMFRAARIFDRCTDVRITEHGVDEPWWRNAIAVPLEWLKLGISETIRRRC
jgi:hypothetical protein